VAGGGPEAGAGDALGDDMAGEGGASIEPRVPSSGALRTEAATVAAIREALACEGEVAAGVGPGLCGTSENFSSSSTLAIRERKE
jgi:hypothetical protein